MADPALPFRDWLSLREPADAAARSEELVALLRTRLAPGPVVVHDLGSGTGSMARWLAPRLAGPQRWVLHDRDDELLRAAAAGPPLAAADSAAVTVETRRSDVTRLAPGALGDADLVTASALLDMFTADELDRFVATCTAAACPTYVALTVTGRVELVPGVPFDAVVAHAFDEHQQRATGTGRLLGPSAVDAAVAVFARAGWDVKARPSPWRLGPACAALAAEWFAGWVGAAVEQQPDLAGRATTYAARRRAEIAEGRLSVTVHHRDLLALPR